MSLIYEFPPGMKEKIGRIVDREERHKEIFSLLDTFDVDNLSLKYAFVGEDHNGYIKIGIGNDPEKSIARWNRGRSALSEYKLIYKHENSCKKKDPQVKR